MKTTKKTICVLRKIWGALLTILILPLIGTTYLLLGICNILAEFWEFVVDLWRQLSDPGYYHIGMGGMMAQKGLMMKAAECWRTGDKSQAAVNWRKAARLFSNEAMFRLAQCYEEGDGLEKDLAKAYECYRLADIYHNPQAEAECERLSRFAMDKRRRNAFLDTIWTK